MALTDTGVKNAKPRERPYKLYDERGLFLLVNPNKKNADGSQSVGSKLWRLKYRFGGKEKLLALGTYPDASLAKARQRRDDARILLEDGIDPSEDRKAKDRAQEAAEASTFKVVALAYMDLKAELLSPATVEKYTRRLELDIFPDLGHRAIGEIRAPELLKVLQKMEERGVRELTHKVRSLCGQIFRYGIRTGKCEFNPAADLKGALRVQTAKPMPAIKADGLPELLQKIDGYDGNEQTRLALQIMALTFIRTTELIGARWGEIDWENELWTIPAERMKGKRDLRREHVVPLAPQTMKLFERLQEMNGHREHVFPAEGNPRKPMSNNTMLFALYRMGYHSRMTGHGFRSVASTILNESGLFRPDVIERQLAHVEPNQVRRAYNKAQYLDERWTMMKWWADLLDKLRTAVTPSGSNDAGRIEEPSAEPQSNVLSSAFTNAVRRVGPGIRAFMG
jgi:integrase